MNRKKIREERGGEGRVRGNRLLQTVRRVTDMIKEGRVGKGIEGSTFQTFAP